MPKALNKYFSLLPIENYISNTVVNDKLINRLCHNLGTSESVPLRIVLRVEEEGTRRDVRHRNNEIVVYSKLQLRRNCKIKNQPEPVAVFFIFLSLHFLAG